MLGAGLADPTPARYDVDLRAAARPASRPQAILDIAPPAETLDVRGALHLPLQRARRHLRVQGRPLRLRAVRLRGRHLHVAGRLRVGLRGDRGRPAHLLRPRHRLRGQRRRRPPPTPGASSASSRRSPPGPASRRARSPPSRPPAARSPSTTATIDFIANVADATYECSLDLEPFAPCTPPVTYTGPDRRATTCCASSRPTSRRRRASWRRPSTSGRSSRSSTSPRPTRRSSARRRPTRSSTIFEFTGTDDLTPPALLTFECRVDSTNELDWFECVSPFNLLDLYTYAGLRRWRPASTPSRCAPSTWPSRSTPTRTSRATSTRRRPRTPGRWWPTRSPPGTGILAGPPATVGAGEILFEFFGTDNATPVLELAFECAVDAAPFEPCESPESRPGPRARRAHLPRPRGRPGRQRRPDAGHAHLDGRARAGHDDHLRPGRPASSTASRPPRRARPRARSSSSRPTRPARPSSARSTAPTSCRAPRRTAFWVVDERHARVRGARDQPGGRRRGAAGRLRVGRRARARLDAAEHDDHVGAEQPVHQRGRHLRVHRQRQPHARGGPDLRVRPRRRRPSTRASRRSSSPT